MSRSGYVYDDDDDDGQLGLWRGSVTRALRGKRGQAFLHEMAAALDAMPVKELIPSALVCEEGCCAMGAVAVARGVVSAAREVDAYDPEAVAKMFGIARALAAEIAYENDDCGAWSGSPFVSEALDARWLRMRKWVERQLRAVKEANDGKP